MFPCKWIAGVFSVFSASLLAAEAIEYYNVTFSSPPHSVGAGPTTGIGSAGPSATPFLGATVVRQFGHLQNQPLLFTAANGYDQIEFSLGHQQSNYYLEFDFESRNLNPSLFGFTAVFDTPTVQTVSLHGGLSRIDIFSGLFPSGNFAGPTWTDDELHHLRIDADIPGGTFTIKLDNLPATVAPFATLSGDVTGIRLNLGAWLGGTADDASVQVAIDNVVIGTVPIPEPGTYVLMALGVATVARLRKRR